MRRPSRAEPTQTRTESREDRTNKIDLAVKNEACIACATSLQARSIVAVSRMSLLELPTITSNLPATPTHAWLSALHTLKERGVSAIVTCPKTA